MLFAEKNRYSCGMDTDGYALASIHGEFHWEWKQVKLLIGLWPCTLQAYHVKPGVFQKHIYF